MHIIDNWREVLLKTYSVWSMILGFIAFMGSEILYKFWGIEADPYPLGIAALVFFAAGFIGRFIKQEPETKTSRRLIFLTAFGFGIFMLFKSLGGAVYWDLVLPEHKEAQVDTQPTVTPVMAQKPKPVAPLPTVEPFDEIAFDLIAKWEGKKNNAYQDLVGVWTICYGHTRTTKPGQYKTDQQCKELLIEEIQEYRINWLKYVNDKAKANWLPATREAAYTSLAFNVGWHGAGTSTATRRLNAGDINGGCEAISWWNKAGGKVVRGLVRRRTEEVALCRVGFV